MGPETRIVNAIMRAFGSGWPHSWFVKIHGGPFQAAGIPDIVGVVEGRFVALEVKCPGKESTTTKLQALTIRRILAAGGIAGVVCSATDAVLFVDERLKA